MTFIAMENAIKNSASFFFFVVASGLLTCCRRGDGLSVSSDLRRM